jgi:hypothetical protein
MSVLNATAAPTNHSRAGTIIKSGASICSLALVSLCIGVLRPSAAECAQESRTTASPRQIPPSAAGTVKPASRFGGSVTRRAEGGKFDQRELRAMNLLGIRYAKGQGVKRNPGLAMRFFLRAAIQGYTPAMANLGTLYEIVATRDSDFQRAYAWVRAALSFGVPEEDHDEMVSKLWMIAARLGPDRIESAETLADAIAVRIVESCKCSPGEEPELASNGVL